MPTDLPCWCGDGTSSVAIYDNLEGRAAHCFKCNKHLLEIDERFKDYYEEVMNGLTVVPIQKNTSAQEFPKRGVITDLLDRGIRQDVADKYCVETIFDAEDKPIMRAYPGYNNNGDLISQKLKPLTPDGNMRWIGTHAGTQLFGQKFFSKGGKYITITEGEEDAMAAYQMLKDANPQYEPAVVSIKDGGVGAVRDCKNSWEFLNSFENIIVCFDGDKVGKDAAEKIAQLFPFKVKVVNFGDCFFSEEEKKWCWKDANDYLKGNRPKDFIQLWYKAEKWAPKGVLTFRSLWDDMIKKETNVLVPFPWDGLNKKAYGLITGKMDVWKAFPKVGKTTLFSELIIHIRKTSSYNVGVIFLESTKKEIGLKLCGVHLDLPADRPDVSVPLDKLQEAHGFLSEDDRITIFDPQDERTVENVFNKIMYFVKAHDCKFIFLDHASMLAYTSDDHDERKFLDKLFADLKQMTTALNIYLGVIIHVNDDGKTRGSRAPVQLCDRLISLNRDKLSEDEVVKNTTDVVVEENRNGDTGLACKLFYNKQTGRMSEMDLEQQLELIKKDVFDK